LFCYFILYLSLFPLLIGQEEEMPYSFFVNEQEMVKGLLDVLEKQSVNDEEVLRIEYQPQAVFRVRQITRCVSSLEGTRTAKSIIRCDIDVFILLLLLLWNCIVFVASLALSCSDC
jgi:hypothetical protein